ETVSGLPIRRLHREKELRVEWCRRQPRKPRPGIAQSFRPEHPRADQRRVDEIPRMEVTVVVTAEFGEEQSRTGLEVCRQRQRFQKRLLEFYRGTSLMSMTVPAARESDVRLPPKIRINRAG